MTQPPLNNKKILLIITGGIAAYKSLELIRALRTTGATIKTILTKAGAEFVTPLSIQALSGENTYQDLWDLTDEQEMGHIQLSRWADLLVIAPATANTLAKMAHGIADDLASTCLLATDTPILAVPAMNVRMWEHAATQDNIKILKARGIEVLGPNAGEMACGEFGMGRMSEPQEILTAIKTKLSFQNALKGKKVIVTAGPTFEPIDPVRFLGNYSSGKQGYAIARALANAGAEVTLISGPTNLNAPQGLNFVPVQTAEEMLTATETALPADIAICTAAVADWKVKTTSAQKIKKGTQSPNLELSENPDILKTLSTHKNRPALVVGFAAETENLERNAKEKILRKGCDWIVANEISDSNPAFGADHNSVTLFTKEGASESWQSLDKSEIAQRLVEKIISRFYDKGHKVTPIRA